MGCADRGLGAGGVALAGTTPMVSKSQAASLGSSRSVANI
jgi:hypothetical protein